MPRILHGQIVQGVGSIGVSQNDHLVLPNAGTPGWFAPYTAICQAQLPGLGWNVTALLGSTAVPLWTGGADVVCAGAGTIAAGANSTTPNTRLQNLHPVRTIPNRIPLDVDRELGLAVMFNRAQGQNLCLYYRENPGAVEDGVIATEAILTARAVGGTITWNELRHGVWTARCFQVTTSSPVPLSTRPGNVYQPLALNAGVGWVHKWLAYSDQDGNGYLHWTDDVTKGWKFDGPCFGLDAEYQPADGSMLVAWCTNQGEAPGSLRTQRCDLTHPPVLR